MPTSEAKVIRYDRWQKLIDLLVVFTAIGMTFLIVFAMLQASRRTDQLREAVRQNQQVLHTVERISQEGEDAVNEHRESALRQHCASAQLQARADGRVSADENKLLGLACRH